MTEKVKFEDLMFTTIEATQETFKVCMDIELFAGRVTEAIPMESDLVGLVGLGLDRVAYVIFSLKATTAGFFAEKLLGMEPEDPEMVRDAVGELINIVAGSIKSKYDERYGTVDLGLPLILSGKVMPGMESKLLNEEPTKKISTLKVQSKSVIIPFKSFDHDLNFNVMVYM